MTTNYIPIQSVLYDLSLTIEERYWNEIKMLEWLAHGFRKLNIPIALEPKTAQLEVVTHKATLPSDFKYLTQVVHVNQITQLESDTFLAETIDPPENTTWTLATLNSFRDFTPMRLSSNPFHSTICLDENQLVYCTDCLHEFSISPSLVLTTTLESGTILVSYLGYATALNGDMLIPNDENLKEALLYYVLYRYWLAKDMMMEQGAAQRMQHYLAMWQTASVKATGNLTLPDINQLENIKANHNRLVPRENKFQQFFTTLGNRENVNF